MQKHNAQYRRERWVQRRKQRDGAGSGVLQGPRLDAKTHHVDANAGVDATVQHGVGQFQPGQHGPPRSAGDIGVVENDFFFGRQGQYNETQGIHKGRTLCDQGDGQCRVVGRRQTAHDQVIRGDGTDRKQHDNVAKKMKEFALTHVHRRLCSSQLHHHRPHHRQHKTHGPPFPSGVQDFHADTHATQVGPQGCGGDEDGDVGGGGPPQTQCVHVVHDAGDNAQRQPFDGVFGIQVGPRFLHTDHQNQRYNGSNQGTQAVEDEKTKDGAFLGHVSANDVPTGIDHDPHKKDEVQFGFGRGGGNGGRGRCGCVFGRLSHGCSKGFVFQAP